MLKNIIESWTQVQGLKKWLYLALVIWLVLIFVSLSNFLSMPLSLWFEPYMILSALLKLILVLCIALMLKKLFIQKNHAARSLGYLKNLVGYGSVASYFAIMLPEAVRDFYLAESTSLWSFSAASISFILAAAIYIALQNTSVLGLLEFPALHLTRKERRKLYRKVKSTRNLLQNLWFEWIDPIISVMILLSVLVSMVFSMYLVPSESMQPEIHPGDRLLVSSIELGPRFPLSTISLPQFYKPRPGDILAIESPKTNIPNGSLSYTTLTAKLFHEFIYRISFSMLDIDPYPNGKPKERLWVKRVLAAEGDRVCMVNGTVYYQDQEGNWAPENPDYTRNDLYQKNHPALEREPLSEGIQLLLDEAEVMVRNTKEESLEKDYFDAQRNLLMVLPLLKPEVLDGYLAELDQRIILDNISLPDLVLLDVDLALQRKLMNLLFFIFEFPSMIDFKTQFSQSQDPYHSFMRNLSLQYRTAQLDFMRDFILYSAGKGENPELSREALLLHFYIYGTWRIPDSFSAGNLPPFPGHEGDRIPEDYFLMVGDNIYNSLDTRFDVQSSVRTLVWDGGLEDQLCPSINTMLNPRPIHMSTVRGKLRSIVYPLNRIKWYW
jgi:signal peptidase I